MQKLSQTQIYVLQRMGSGTPYLARGDGRKDDEMRVDRAYSAQRRVNAPSIPPLIRFGFVEFVNADERDKAFYYRVRLTDKGRKLLEGNAHGE
ncbi:hypothetical protein V9T10_000165 [Yersinia enterocolitica]|uniref:hypothetical protein n=1 Tax=Yersinia ruckeri TaxID=29486 RepID=UPI002238C81B|nr:hypothetical protein [Yersinia ruckeri]MCW6576465.1 hypothetical protein [Yersinia ruckeri]